MGGTTGKNSKFSVLLALDANEEIPDFQVQKESFCVCVGRGGGGGEDGSQIA